MYKILNGPEVETKDETLAWSVMSLPFRYLGQLPPFLGLGFLFCNDNHYYKSDTTGHLTQAR